MVVMAGSCAVGGTIGIGDECLWAQYKLTGSTEVRNQLIESNLNIVKYHADRISSHSHYRVDSEDLVAAGVFGLMDAVDAFEPARGLKFSTFASYRVRGAMLDELRATDWVPRLVRQRTNQLEAARNRRLAASGIEPTNDELIDELQVDSSEFQKISHDAGITSMISMQGQSRHQKNDSDRDLMPANIISDHLQVDPMENVARSEMQDICMQDLSEVEGMIVKLYYYEGMTMREMSKAMGISESRICQLHHEILAKLRVSMRRVEITSHSMSN